MKQILPIFIFLEFLCQTTGAQSKIPEHVDEFVIAKCIEVAPIYPGGPKAMHKLFHDSANYLKTVRKYRLEGTVIVGYSVDTFGNTINIKILKGLNNELDSEAVRLIRLLKGWAPAMQNERKVIYTCSQPFIFRTHKRVRQKLEK